MPDATEKCHNPELSGNPMRLELFFTLRQEHVNELIVLGEQMFLVSIDKFGVVGKSI